MIKSLFSPEFLNRFDGIVVFEPIEGENLVKTAQLMALILSLELDQ